MPRGGTHGGVFLPHWSTSRFYDHVRKHPGTVATPCETILYWTTDRYPNRHPHLSFLPSSNKIFYKAWPISSDRGEGTRVTRIYDGVTYAARLTRGSRPSRFVLSLVLKPRALYPQCSYIGGFTVHQMEQASRHTSSGYLVLFLVLRYVPLFQAGVHPTSGKDLTSYNTFFEVTDFGQTHRVALPGPKISNPWCVVSFAEFNQQKCIISWLFL